MKIKSLVFTALLALTLPAISFADKPEWAGEGGKPSEREKEEHKEDMTSKHEDKKNKDKKNKNKHDQDKDWDDIEDDARDKVADEIDRKIRGN